MSAGRVDVHTHILPGGYRAALARHGLEAIAGAAAPEWSPRLHEEFVNKWGIETAIAISDPGVYFGDAGEASELARLVNDEAATLVRRPPAVPAAAHAASLVALGAGGADTSPLDEHCQPRRDRV
jgi:hypothetical protein